jgi:VanZ family protein
MGLIFAASSIPDLTSLPGNVSDKTGHNIGYALLAALLVRALARGQRSKVTARCALFAAVLATAYGVTDEFHQSFVPGRSPDVQDVLADAEGAAAASLGAWAILKAVSAATPRS